MGIEHLNEKELKSIKNMNALLKYLKLIILLFLGLVIFVIILPIAMAFFMKRPDKWLESVEWLLTIYEFYILIGISIIFIGNYMSTSKLMTIINKLMKSDREK